MRSSYTRRVKTSRNLTIVSFLMVPLNMPPQLRSQTAEIEHRFRRN
ncbi:MAG: hypothetical protein PHY12_10300 [Eubacteriales bacterium]|nr:hypothetical protein [Eubacteriales bacterium]